MKPRAEIVAISLASTCLLLAGIGYAFICIGFSNLNSLEFVAKLGMFMLVTGILSSPLPLILSVFLLCTRRPSIWTILAACMSGFLFWLMFAW